MVWKMWGTKTKRHQSTMYPLDQPEPSLSRRPHAWVVTSCITKTWLEAAVLGVRGLHENSSHQAKTIILSSPSASRGKPESMRHQNHKLEVNKNYSFAVFKPGWWWQGMQPTPVCADGPRMFGGTFTSQIYFPTSPGVPKVTSRLQAAPRAQQLHCHPPLKVDRGHEFNPEMKQEAKPGTDP